MNYYVKENKLYAPEIPVKDSSYVLISKEEYEQRMELAVSGREKGKPADKAYEW